jgi:hypothetical protein
MLRKSAFFKLLLVFIIPLLLTACENSTETNPPPDSTNTFPNKVGDQWIYSVYDSLSHSVDTLIIRIVGMTVGNGKDLTIWTRKSNFYNDTIYVYVNRDTVYFYDDAYPIVADHKIEFPLEVGKYWINTDQVSDSSIVKNIESVTVPVDTYSSAYRIERDGGSFNVYGHSVTWFVDNIGIVKLYQRIQGFDNIKETWELLDFISIKN